MANRPQPMFPGDVPQRLHPATPGPCKLVGGDRIIGGTNAEYTEDFAFRGLGREGYRIRLPWMSFTTDRSGEVPDPELTTILFFNPTVTALKQNVMLLNEEVLDWYFTNYGQGIIVPATNGTPWTLRVTATQSSALSALAFGWEYERVSFLGDSGYQ